MRPARSMTPAVAGGAKVGVVVERQARARDDHRHVLGDALGQASEHRRPATAAGRTPLA